MRRRWCVLKTIEGIVWCDATSIATGIMIEIEGQVVEDAAWLRKRSNFSHINSAELNATIKGINLALKWGLKRLK